MIFGNEYDKSLYLIIKNDRRNRDEIVDFLKLMPYEFILRIQNNVDEYKKYKINSCLIRNDNKKTKYFNSEICTKDGYLYSYNIDVNTGMLSISRSVYLLGAYYKQFEIKLLEYSTIDNYVKQNIGSITYGFNNNVDIKSNCESKLRKFDYDVIKIPFKNLLFSFENNRLVGVESLVIDKLNNNVDMIEDRLINNKKRCLRKD